MSLLRKLREVQRERKTEKHISGAELRLQKDIEELMENRSKLSEVATRIEFGSGSKLKFKVMVYPSKGPYKDGHFVFNVAVPEDYPFSAPEVYSTFPIFHPNICLQTGKVGLKILMKHGWKPTFTVDKVIRGFAGLFLSPELETAINSHCAKMMNTDNSTFHKTVKTTMKGGFFFGQSWKPTFFTEDVHTSRCMNKRIHPKNLGKRIEHSTKRRRHREDSQDVDVIPQRHEERMPKSRKIISQISPGISSFSKEMVVGGYNPCRFPFGVVKPPIKFEASERKILPEFEEKSRRTNKRKKKRCRESFIEISPSAEHRRCNYNNPHLDFEMICSKLSIPS
eukprot:jgi/Bigna1/91690/estExt_fgenesh1_pg.C_1130036